MLIIVIVTEDLVSIILLLVCERSEPNMLPVFGVVWGIQNVSEGMYGYDIF